MTKKSISQPRVKRKYNTVLRDNPELLELLTDLAIFTRKWQAPQIAKTVKLSRQSLEVHIDKRRVSS